jgi:hypothetical protein
MTLSFSVTVLQTHFPREYRFNLLLGSTENFIMSPFCILN